MKSWLTPMCRSLHACGKMKVGRLVGFAYVNRYQNLVDAFVVEKFTPAIETELIDWVVSAARRRNQEIGQSLTLAASALESEICPGLLFWNAVDLSTRWNHPS